MGMPSARERTELSDAIAAQIRAERSAARMTIEKTAEKSGIPYGTYRKLDAGTRTVDAEQLNRLCRNVFGISLRDFFVRVEQRMAAAQADDDDTRPNGPS